MTVSDEEERARGSSNPPATLAEWLDSPVTPRDINELAKDSRKRFNLIENILREVRK